MRPLRIVVLGLTITSSWGNGHATTYRGLVGALVRRGHAVTFLERDVPWYAGARDLDALPGAEVLLYEDLDALRRRHADRVRDADVVVVGSYVPDGVAVGAWAVATARGVTVFYDIDTPVTLAKLARGDREYLSEELIPRFDLYLSFTGGPTLRLLERRHGARMARALYCSVDAEQYGPEDVPVRWDCGYLGTYSPDRQPTVGRLLVEPASAWPEGRFIVAGPQYPDDEIGWPANVDRSDHLPPAEHRAFYNAQRFTLNVTRADMIAAGWSPSVRLFEAAACATPIVSDWWDGLDALFTPGEEILIARDAGEMLGYLRALPEARRRAIGQAGRRRVLSAHTAVHRAAEFEAYVAEAQTARAIAARPGAAERPATASVSPPASGGDDDHDAPDHDAADQPGRAAARGAAARRPAAGAGAHAGTGAAARGPAAS